jgi:hypothetical protein
MFSANVLPNRSPTVLHNVSPSKCRDRRKGEGGHDAHCLLHQNKITHWNSNIKYFLRTSENNIYSRDLVYLQRSIAKFLVWYEVVAIIIFRLIEWTNNDVFMLVYLCSWFYTSKRFTQQIVDDNPQIFQNSSFVFFRSDLKSQLGIKREL